jgi:hypothetical protein
MDNLGSLGSSDNMDGLGSLGILGSLDNLDGLDSLNGLDSLGSVDGLGSLGSMDSLDGLVSLGSVDGLGSLGSMDSLDGLGSLDSISSIIGTFHCVRHPGDRRTGIGELSSARAEVTGRSPDNWSATGSRLSVHDLLSFVLRACMTWCLGIEAAMESLLLFSPPR